MFHLPISPTSALGKAAAFTGRHSPLILVITAAAGAVSSCVMAVKATTKAEQLLAERKDEIAYQEEVSPDQVELTPREIVKTVWKLYLAPAICLTLSIACMFLSLKISTGRNLALAGLYSSSQEALRRYEDKVIEAVGEKGNEAIRNRVIEQKLVDHPVPPNMVPGKDEYLCYDDYSDRYWMGNLNNIMEAKNRVNELLEHNMYISLNDFYEMIGLPIAGCGRDAGWTVDERMDLTWTTKRATNGYPCVVIFYDLAEHYNHGMVC